MARLDYIFFDEFKRLDRLCGEIYGDEHGVTAYIEDMKTVTAEKYRLVPNFTADLEGLKHVRYIRNKLAHDAGAFDEQLSTQGDIDFVRSFYLRIMNGTDPMATLAKLQKMKKQTTARAYTPAPASARSYTPPPIQKGPYQAKKKHRKSRKRKSKLLVAALLLVAAAAFLLWYKATHG